MNVLFVCSRNRRRSPTAEEVFQGVGGLECASAGTAPDADTPVSSDLLEWADLVVAMEPVHRRRLQQRFAQVLHAKRVVVLDIPDKYAFMDEELIDRLRTALARHISHVEGEPRAI